MHKIKTSHNFHEMPIKANVFIFKLELVQQRYDSSTKKEKEDGSKLHLDGQDFH